MHAGNDLARCLNWCGSMGSYASHNARDMLRAVNHSTVALLDRWNVSIQPTVRRSNDASCQADVCLVVSVPSP